MAFIAIGLCIPLLAVVCALSTSGAALVTGVTRDTACVSAMCSVVRYSLPRVDCTPYLLLVKVTAEEQMSAKILSGARFFEAAQARDRDCSIRRTAIAVMGSRRTDCRTFTGYRLSLGVRGSPLC